MLNIVTIQYQSKVWILNGKCVPNFDLYLDLIAFLGADLGAFIEIENHYQSLSLKLVQLDVSTMLNENISNVYFSLQ